jgi:hypothetical protein
LKKSCEEILSFCDTFKLSNKEKEWVEFYFRGKDLDQDPVEWAYYLADPKSTICLDVLSHSLPDREEFLAGIQANIKQLFPHILRIQNKTPLISSQDLMREGIQPGISMGALLKQAERIAITKNSQSREVVLDELRSSEWWPR